MIVLWPTSKTQQQLQEHQTKGIKDEMITLAKNNVGFLRMIVRSKHIGAF